MAYRIFTEQNRLNISIKQRFTISQKFYKNIRKQYKPCHILLSVNKILEAFNMSDLSATNCGSNCGCEVNSCGNNNNILFILLILFCCGGCGNNGCGNGGFLGGNNGCGCESIIIILLLLSCCGGGNSFCC